MLENVKFYISKANSALTALPYILLCGQTGWPGVPIMPVSASVYVRIRV